jgi:hypothetical protein
MGAVDALRATTAAPWYMEELALAKELSLGRTRLARDPLEEDDGGSSSVDVPDELDDAFVLKDTVDAPRVVEHRRLRKKPDQK